MSVQDKEFYEIDEDEGVISPDLLLLNYSNGYFPMWDSQTNKIYWYSAQHRAIFPLNSTKIRRSVKQSANKLGFRFELNKDFNAVITHCAQCREDTWISEKIIRSFVNLHNLGFAHSAETWIDDQLVGGLYGVVIGGAFFGESMFSLVSDASKFAFYNLRIHLIKQNFYLLDAQFINEHTASLGAIEIPDKEYINLLSKAIFKPCKFI